MTYSVKLKHVVELTINNIVQQVCIRFGESNIVSWKMNNVKFWIWTPIWMQQPTRPLSWYTVVNHGLIIYVLTKQRTSSTKVDALHSILSEKLSLENIWSDMRKVAACAGT